MWGNESVLAGSRFGHCAIATSCYVYFVFLLFKQVPLELLLLTLHEAKDHLK